MRAASRSTSAGSTRFSPFSTRRRSMRRRASSTRIATSLCVSARTCSRLSAKCRASAITPRTRRSGWPPRIRPAADRRPHRIQRPQFLDRLVFSSVMGIGLYGLTYIYPVYLAVGARLHAVDDRRDDVRHGRLHVHHGADLRPVDDEGRSAADDRDRLCRLRVRHLAGLRNDRRLGFLRIARSADVSRLLA